MEICFWPSSGIYRRRQNEGRETGEMKKLFKPIFEKYRVNAYICGHDHNLQYIKPPGFTYYFVSGAGSELSKTVIHPEGGIFARAENGFMNFSVSANQIAGHRYQLYGRAFVHWNHT